MNEQNYKVLYFYKDENNKYIDDHVIVTAIDKKDAEIEARKMITVNIEISKIEEYEYKQQ